MNCSETKSLLNAYVDGELDALRSRTLESHVQRCALCLTEVESLQAISSAIEDGALRFKAPLHLKRKVQAAIRDETPEARRFFLSWRWVTALGSAALIVALMLTVTTWRTQPSQETELLHDIVSSHVRSMMADHITDVSSSDSHTVKPWFASKLDYSPPAKDLTGQGFRLIGGRLDYLDNRPVAAVVYQRNLHFINLFVWPSNRSTVRQDRVFTFQGYNVIHWTESDMTYWLISELERADLNECARLLKE